MAEHNRRAIVAARVYLEMRGYEVIEQGFRRPRTIVDIIAQKGTTIYFIDVTYRKDDDSAYDTPALTNEAVRNLRLAAANWLEETKWSGLYQFGRVEIVGNGYVVMGFIDKLF